MQGLLNKSFKLLLCVNSTREFNNPYLRISLVKLFLICFCLTTGSTLLAAPKTDNNLDSVTLKLKWKHQFQFAGYYAALEKGFYRQAGLDVNIISLRGIPSFFKYATSSSECFSRAIRLPDSS